LSVPRPRERDPAETAGQAPLAVAVAGIVLGALLWFAGLRQPATWLWAATTATVLAPLTLETLTALRRGELGVDLIALAAMAAALLLRENLAGAVIALMMAGGQAVETLANRRARRDLARLLGRAPSFCQRRDGKGFSSVPIAELRPGDSLLIRPGDVLPVDGVISSAAVLDESALTGEAMPVDRPAGERVRSGTVNAGGAFEMHAAATAEDSTYARVVRLVAAAQRAKAPLVRLADRYARAFLALTAVVAGGAWLLSGDAHRALAVLVIATPCPLILAAPAAFVAGLSRAARRGIIVKGGRALEGLALARVALIDKTGTLTAGQAALREIVVFGADPESEILRLAASLDQVSAHVFAGPIVDAARLRSLDLVFPTDVEERAGRGISGTVGERRVTLGSLRWLLDRGIAIAPAVLALHHRTARDGMASVLLAVDDRLAGVLLLEDPLREDAPAVIAALRRGGIARIVLVTGDHGDVAARVGERLGVDRVIADCSPEDKLSAVEVERRGGPVVMVGDGINDAPALAAADVGVAMAPRGAAAPAEAADVVLTVDRLDRLVEAISIARRVRRIALQSVVAGMGLSGAGMLWAALGGLQPLVGAFFQEAIDVAVLLNALRALLPGRELALALPEPPDAAGGRAPTSRGVAAATAAP